MDTIAHPIKPAAQSSNLQAIRADYARYAQKQTEADVPANGMQGEETPLHDMIVECGLCGSQPAKHTFDAYMEPWGCLESNSNFQK